MGIPFHRAGKSHPAPPRRAEVFTGTKSCKAGECARVLALSNVFPSMGNTGDPEFKALEKEIRINWLDRASPSGHKL
jgi:hypothetical protein